VIKGGPSVEGLLDRMSYMLPATFAIGHSLAQLGAPGHRSGLVSARQRRITAACVAGVLSLENGLRITTERGRLMDEASPGAMAAVSAGQERVAEAILPFGDQVSIAPTRSLHRHLRKAQGRRGGARRARGARPACQRIKSGVAGHSVLMDPILERYGSFLAKREMTKPSLELVSTVTGEPALEELAAHQHWVRNLRQPVRSAPRCRPRAGSAAMSSWSSVALDTG